MKVNVLALNLVGVFVLMCSMTAWACGPAMPTTCETDSYCEQYSWGCTDTYETYYNNGSCQDKTSVACEPDTVNGMSCAIAGDLCEPDGICDDDWESSGYNVTSYQNEQGPCGG